MGIFPPISARSNSYALSPVRWTLWSIEIEKTRQVLSLEVRNYTVEHATQRSGDLILNENKFAR